MSARQVAMETELRSTKEGLRIAQQTFAEAAEKAARAKYYLALAEESLFRKAAGTLDNGGQRTACQAAADASVEEIQRRLREWDEIRTRRRAPPAPPAKGELPPQKGPLDSPPRPMPNGEDVEEQRESHRAKVEPLVHIRQ